jgi:large subunit ribosomal protein L6
MSRIGRLPIQLPQGVSLKVGSGFVEVKGPKGDLTTPLLPGISCKIEDGSAQLSRRSDAKRERAFHGLTRALLANAIKGVTDGFSKNLEIQGIGYRAQLKGSDLELSLGFSHPVLYKVPEGVKVSVDKKLNTITVAGIDRQKVGQVAADIRRLKPPEPYKGKGIRYVGERVRRKVGKTGA